MPHSTSTQPKILCFHGGGTSAAIFKVQLRKLQATLKMDFDFIYIDAPFEGKPGPGVSHIFANSGPYRWWFQKTQSLEPEISVTNLVEFLAIELARQRLDPSSIVGVLGFSQGAVAVTCLLQRMEVAGLELLPSSNFAVLICGAYEEPLISLPGDEIRMASIHVHGKLDPWVAQSRLLTSRYCEEDATCLVAESGHQIPHDIQQIANLIRDVSGREDAKRIQGLN